MAPEALQNILKNASGQAARKGGRGLGNWAGERRAQHGRAGHRTGLLGEVFCSARDLLLRILNAGFGRFLISLCVTAYRLLGTTLGCGRKAYMRVSSSDRWLRAQPATKQLSCPPPQMPEPSLQAAEWPTWVGRWRSSKTGPKQFKLQDKGFSVRWASLD